MPKATCYVTEHYTVEVDLDEVKQIYGSVTKANIKDAAYEAVFGESPYQTTVVFEEIEKKEKPRKVKRGRGSY